MSKEVAQYHKPSTDFLDEAEDFNQAHTDSGRDINRMELDLGENRVRVLPAWDEEGRWAQPYFMHWNLPVPGDRTSFPCSKDYVKQDGAWVATGQCLFCESIEPFRESRSDLYDNYKAKLRWDFNVLDMDNPKEGVKILGAPPKDIAAEIFKYASSWGDPTDPEEGYCFVITKKKKKGFARYDVMPERDPTPLPDWDVLNELWDLRKLLDSNILSLSDQRAVISGETQEPQTALPEGESMLEVQSEKVSSSEEVEGPSITQEAAQEQSASELLRERMSSST